MKRGTGCKRPEHTSEEPQYIGEQERRARAGTDESPLPARLDYTDKMMRVRDQGSSSMCVAYAACAMKEHQDQMGRSLVGLDPSSIYERRKNKPAEGMFVSDAMRILHEYGVDPQAHLHRIRIAWRANQKDIETVKRALFAYGVCVASFPAKPEDSTDERFWLVSGTSVSPDGHCVAIVGYDDARGAFKLRNSWGTDYGDGGYAWIKYEEFAAFCWEVWFSEPAVEHNNKSRQEDCCAACTLQ